MKKIVIILIILLAANVSAQDTMSLPVGSRYYYQMWPVDSTFILEATTKYDIRDGEIVVYSFFTPDTLTVYGIAAQILRDSINPYMSHPEIYVYDSTPDSCYEYLRLYDFNPPMPTLLGEQLRVHILDTPSYYWDFYINTWMGANHPEHRILPMYERFFSNPVQIIDTFCIGLTNYHVRRDTVINDTNYLNLWYHLYATGMLDWTFKYKSKQWGLSYYNYRIPGTITIDSTRCWVPDSYFTHTFPFYFPILVPPDSIDNPSDTTVAPGDTVAISTQAMLQRYVNVVPNPASTTAQVISSFGLTGIEVIDDTGRKIDDITPSGYSHSIDTRKWPVGVYLLRIHTGTGTITKKLVVQR